MNKTVRGILTQQTRHIEHAFEDLSQSLRVLLEADHHANRAGLMFTDRAEAVGNIETALSAVLNAFHSLYDAIEKQLGAQPIDWYQNGALATILAIRNARHHNKAHKIRTLYTYHVHEAERVDQMEQYVLVDFPATEEGADTFDVYMSWADLDQLLKLHKKESRIRPATAKAIREYLHSSMFSEYAGFYQQEEKRVFFNVVPLIVNAAATIVPLIKAHTNPQSTESKFFTAHFGDLALAKMQQPEVNCGPFVLPE